MSCTVQYFTYKNIKLCGSKIATEYPFLKNQGSNIHCCKMDIMSTAIFNKLAYKSHLYLSFVEETCCTSTQFHSKYNDQEETIL